MIKKSVEAVSDRLRLVVPTKGIVEEIIATNYSGSKARLTLQWRKSLVEKFGIDVPEFVRRTIAQIASPSLDISQYNDSNFLTLTVSSKLHTADNLIKPLRIPLYIEYGDTTYGIESPDSGSTFNVIRDGEVVEEDCPSVAFAIGKLQKHLLVDLSYSEELEDPDENVEHKIDVDFMVGIAEWMMHSPAVPEEAKKNLTLFVEFLTNRDFESEEQDGIE